MNVKQQNKSCSNKRFSQIWTWHQFKSIILVIYTLHISLQSYTFLRPFISDFKSSFSFLFNESLFFFFFLILVGWVWALILFIGSKTPLIWRCNFDHYSSSGKPTFAAHFTVWELPHETFPMFACICLYIYFLEIKKKLWISNSKIHT